MATRMDKVKTLLREDRIESANIALLEMLQADRSTVRRNMWRFVRRMIFNPKVPTARVNLKNTTMELGTSFFLNNVDDYIDLQFLLMHERSHIFLRRFMYFNTPAFLPKGNILNSNDLNFFEDTIVNAMSYRMLSIPYGLPDKTYKDSPDIMSCLTLHLRGSMLDNANLVARHDSLYQDPFDIGILRQWLMALYVTFTAYKKEESLKAASKSMIVVMQSDGQGENDEEPQEGLSLPITGNQQNDGSDTQENGENATEGQQGDSQGNPGDAQDNEDDRASKSGSENEDEDQAEGDDRASQSGSGDDEQDEQTEGDGEGQANGESENGEDGDSEDDGGDNASGTGDEGEDSEGEGLEDEGEGEDLEDEGEDENAFSFGDSPDEDDTMSSEELKDFDALGDYNPLVDSTTSQEVINKQDVIDDSPYMDSDELGKVATKIPDGCNARKFPAWDKYNTPETAIENELILVTQTNLDRYVVNLRSDKRLYENRLKNVNAIASEFKKEFSVYGNDKVITAPQLQMPSSLSRRDAFSMGMGHIPAMWQTSYSQQEYVKFDIWADVSGSMNNYVGMIPIILRQLGHLAGDVWNFSTENVKMDVRDYQKYFITSGGTEFEKAFAQMVINKNPYVIFISDGCDDPVRDMRAFHEFMKFKKRLIYVLCKDNYSDDSAGLRAYADKVIEIDLR